MSLIKKEVKNEKIITVLVVVALLAVIVPAGLSCSGPSDEETSTPANETSTPVEEPTEPVEFEVSGTMERTQQTLDPNPKTENGQMTLANNIDYWDLHGTLEGTIVGEYTMVVYVTAGTFTLEGQGTFTGTVNGKSGSFFYNTVGSGQFTSFTGDAGVITTDESIISGTGELANLCGGSHSEYAFDANGSSGTYSGTCWFEE